MENELKKTEKVQNSVELSMADVDRVKYNILAFQKLKSEIMKAGIDKCVIQNKEVLTRAGYDVTALAFNISTSTEIVDRIIKDKNYEIHVKVRAILPNGRFCDGIGVCDSSEFATGSRITATIHNIESKAATRARNRAIADLVGGGILSKEELEVGDNNITESTPIQQPNQPITSKQLNYLNKLITTDQIKEYTNNYLINLSLNDVASLSKINATKLIDDIKNKTIK